MLALLSFAAGYCDDLHSKSLAGVYKYRLEKTLNTFLHVHVLEA